MPDSAPTDYKALAFTFLAAVASGEGIDMGEAHFEAADAEDVAALEDDVANLSDAAEDVINKMAEEIDSLHDETKAQELRIHDLERDLSSLREDVRDFED
jgi:predicted  nucleic acid-binding Zn-ribbon protein